MTKIKNVVLVHGAFADGSGWKVVADILKKDGYKVSVAGPSRPTRSAASLPARGLIPAHFLRDSVDVRIVRQ